MKHITEYYKDWYGESHTANSCHPVHDSAEAIDFAEFYHKQMMENRSENIIQSIIENDEIEDSMWEYDDDFEISPNNSDLCISCGSPHRNCIC